MGNNTRKKMLGIGTDQLKLKDCCTLIFHDVLYSLGIKQNLLLVLALLKLGYLTYLGISLKFFMGYLFMGVVLFLMVSLCWMLRMLILILSICFLLDFAA